MSAFDDDLVLGANGAKLRATGTIDLQRQFALIRLDSPIR
jgi:hypothetical protein